MSTSIRKNEGSLRDEFLEALPGRGGVVDLLDHPVLPLDAESVELEVVVLFVRTNQELLDKLEELRRRQSRKMPPGMTLSTADIARAILWEAIERTERDDGRMSSDEVRNLASEHQGGNEALVHAAHDGDARDPPRAQARADEKLAGGGKLIQAPGGCANLAYHLMNGRGTRPEPQRAMTLYEQACDGGVPSACVAEVIIRTSRSSEFVNPSRTAVARRRGCELGAEILCDGSP